MGKGPPAMTDAGLRVGGHGRRGVRRAELVSALSLAVDLGLGQPMEHVLRASLIGGRLGEAIGLDDDDRLVVFYASLLAWVGCHADSHELAAWFGDEMSFRSDIIGVDRAGFPLLVFLFGHLGAGRPLPTRARLAGTFLITGRTAIMESITTHCLVTAHLAERLGLGGAVADAVRQLFERWDGKGWPSGLRADELNIPIRIVQLAHTVEVFARSWGVESAVEVARRRRGSQFDPMLVDVFCRNAAAFVGGGTGATSWDEVIDSEPGLRPVLSEEEFDSSLEAIADFVDLKTPDTAGHSRAVAQVAAEAGRRSGLSVAECVWLRRAGLAHDLGRLGVSNTIWEKTGPLGPAEWERVRLYPYLTERILARPEALRRLGALAATHQERLDGSGYPKGLSATALGPSARLLAAADAYRTMIEPRPGRAALNAEEAARQLRAEVAAGRLDGQAVDAVLAAAGHRVRRRREWPAGLTAREVEVLALLARACSNAEIARRLYVSTKTVRHHVEHVYTKLGVSSRVEASLFAMQHGLLEAAPPTEK